MAGYNEIRGLRVKYLSADPATPEDGQVWYNSTTGNLRVDGIALGTASWASGGAMGTARASMGSLGTQTANMVVAGYAPTQSNTAQTYDGSSWSSIPSLSAGTRRSNAGFGTTAAAASLGGSIGSLPPTANTVNYVEEYDGSSWTAATGYPVGVYDIEACGTQTAGLGAGGYTTPSDPGTTVNTNFDYNGSSWTANNNMNNARNNFSMTGIQTASLVAGDTGPANVNNVEEYDGTSWTAGTVYPSTLTYAASAGTSTVGLVFLGDISPVTGYGATSNTYDGTSWAASASLANAGGNTEGCGTGVLALAASGGPSAGRTAGSEEYTGATTETKNLSTS
jgi:hypothetical protein